MIRDRLLYLQNHWFVRGVASLQIGIFFGNFIQAFVGIFIARLLQPELFGVYAVSFGLASLASILLGSGIQEAVTNILGKAYAHRDKQEISLAFGFLVKMTTIAGLISILVAFILPFVARLLYSNTQIGIFAGIVLIASVISTSFFAFCQIALQLMGKIGRMTSLIIVDQATRFGLSLLLVYLGFGIWGAAMGHLIGAGIIFVISVTVWRKLKREDTLIPSLMGLIINFYAAPVKKYFSYSFWVAVDRNMGNLYMTLPVVLSGVYLASGEVTFFKLAFGFVNLALSLLGPISTLLNIEFPKTQALNSHELFAKFKKVSFYAVGLSTALTIAAIIVSPLAFKILYGESFMASVKYILGLIIYGCLFGIGVGLGPMWRAVNKVKVSILINTIILGVGIPLGLVLVKLLNIWGAVIMVTIWFTVSHFASFIYLYRNLRLKNI